uniref:Uncharacterized protein n=1 Tax=Meloidogyne hapla TaxID=6305 RepID=A0A1I8B2J7_MELHA
MSAVQCAQCSNSPACNADPFYEKQLFCWEKDANKWSPTRGRRVCEGGLCFIGIDHNQMVEQNCGDCPAKFKNCVTCKNKNSCNEESLLPLQKI